MKKIPCSILTWFSRLNRGWRTIVFFTAGHDSFTFLVIYAWPVLTLSVSGLSSWSPWSLFTEVKEESVSCSLFPLESLPMTQQRQRQKEQKDYFLLKWPPAVVVAETRRWQWLSSLEWHFSLTRESVEKDFAILYFMQSILLSHIYFVFERLTLIPSLIGSKTEFREEEGRVKFWRWWGNKRRKETCHITPLISCVHWFWVLLLNLSSHTRHVILLCPLVSSLVFSISCLWSSLVYTVSLKHTTLILLLLFFRESSMSCFFARQSLVFWSPLVSFCHCLWTDRSISGNNRCQYSRTCEASLAKKDIMEETCSLFSVVTVIAWYDSERRYPFVSQDADSISNTDKEGIPFLLFSHFISCTRSYKRGSKELEELDLSCLSDRESRVLFLFTLTKVQIQRE